MVGFVPPDQIGLHQMSNSFHGFRVAVNQFQDGAMIPPGSVVHDDVHYCNQGGSTEFLLRRKAEL